MAAVTEQELTRIERAATERVGPGAKLGDIIVDGDVVVAPVTTLGSVGVLLDRRSDQLIVLGSALTLDDYVWAHAHGFRIQAPNTVRITLVRDLDAAREVLRGAVTPRVLHYQGIDLRSVPVTLSLDWPQTALLIELLRTSAAFDYEVNPS